MKKILGLTIAVVLVIGLVAGGTWAYFSDTETTTGNTFTAGTIDLSLDPDTGQAVADGALEDLKPCQTGFIVITLSNDGENEMDVWKMITSVVCTGGTETDAELAEPANDAIDEVIIYDMWIEVGGDPLAYDAGTDELIVDEATGLHIDDIDEFYIYLGTLASGAEMVIVQSYHMEALTTNWAQGDVMTFTMEFFALQTVGSPTTDALPGPEHPDFPGPLPAP